MVVPKKEIASTVPSLKFADLCPKMEVPASRGTLNFGEGPKGKVGHFREMSPKVPIRNSYDD